MKALKAAIVAILLLNVGISLFNWFATEETPSAAQYIQPEIPAAEGLELVALTSLVKEIRSGQELERRLNEKDGINNMDLNGDDKVDYISVSEFGDVQRKIGYSMVIEPEKNEKQEIAIATVELNQDKAEIQVVGNEQVYGDNAIYNDWTTVERPKEVQHSGSASYAFPLLASYFLLRPLWMSPFYYGYYPSYYSPYPTTSPNRYSNRVSSKRSSSVKKGANNFQRTSKTSITSPNKGKTANKGITRSLKKPTSTQKQFQATQRRSVRSGGFGKSGSKSSSSQSIFGSKKSSSSFRSSVSRSRSFSFSGK